MKKTIGGILMSYSFTWNCTLDIDQIQDIISVNIVPATTIHHEFDYLSLRGDILIDGEYIGHEQQQHCFKERIPLEIILPNNNRVDDIITKVTNFDYEIVKGESLFLKVDLELNGYIDPRESEPAHLDYADLEELVLEQSQEIAETLKALEIENAEMGETLSASIEVTPEPREDEPVAVGAEVVEVEAEADAVSPPQPQLTSELQVTSETAEEARDQLVAEVTEIKAAPPLTTELEAIEEERVPLKALETIEPVATQVSLPPTETVPVIEEAEPEEEVKRYIPKKSRPQRRMNKGSGKEESLSRAEGESPQKAEGESLFDMLYSFDEHSSVEFETVAPEILDQPVAHTLEEAEEKEISFFSDRVARQFADGASIIKIVFIQEEVTLANICARYEIKEEAIYNLESLGQQLKHGDCVMINYGRAQ